MNTRRLDVSYSGLKWWGYEVDKYLFFRRRYSLWKLWRSLLCGLEADTSEQIDSAWQCHTFGFNNWPSLSYFSYLLLMFLLFINILFYFIWSFHCPFDRLCAVWRNLCHSEPIFQMSFISQLESRLNHFARQRQLLLICSLEQTHQTCGCWTDVDVTACTNAEMKMKRWSENEKLVVMGFQIYGGSSLFHYPSSPAPFIFPNVKMFICFLMNQCTDASPLCVCRRCGRVGVSCSPTWSRRTPSWTSWSRSWTRRRTWREARRSCRRRWMSVCLSFASFLPRW